MRRVGQAIATKTEGTRKKISSAANRASAKLDEHAAEMTWALTGALQATEGAGQGLGLTAAVREALTRQVVDCHEDQPLGDPGRLMERPALRRRVVTDELDEGSG